MIRTMRGKIIDMNKLYESNKNALAVTGSSLKLNARGDIVSSKGEVVKSVEEISKEFVVHKTRENISLNDSEKMKKFYMKKKFLTPKEIQEQLRQMEKTEKENINNFGEEEKDLNKERKNILRKSVRKN